MATIRALKTFLCVAQSGSFAAAAEKVGLTPAGVSQQMRLLEDSLGHQLFDRIGKKLSLNERGLRFLPRARRLMDQFDELMTSPDDADDPVGTINAEAIASCMSLLVKATFHARERFRRLTIRPAVGYSTDLSARVEAGQSDAAVAVRSQRPIAAGTLWTTLYFEPFVFIANRQSTEGFDRERLMHERLFLRPTLTTHTGALIDRFLKDKRISFGESLEMQLSRTLVELVEQDAGVTIVPLARFSSWEENPRLRIEHLGFPDGRREIGFMESERKRQLTSHLRQLLIELSREQFLSA
nr:LysR family transcriptional regulator [Bradyrhizobium sp. Ec3.3]